MGLTLCTFYDQDFAKRSRKNTDELIPAIKKAQELNASGKTVLIDVHSNLEGRRSFPEV